MKTGIVFEGGAFRTIFSCGVMDAFIAQDIMPDYIIGTSAGATYAPTYAARQSQRNLNLILRYAKDKNYMGVNNLLNPKNRCIFNLEFAYETIPNELIPFDYEAFKAWPGELYATVTNVLTGEAEYMRYDGTDKTNQILRATCALPVLFPYIYINDVPYLDGGLSDSIPFEKAFKDGCDRVVVILTREAGYRKKTSSSTKIMARAYHRYPKLASALINRSRRYNKTLRRIEKLEKEGKLIVIRPDSTKNFSRLETDPDKLLALYTNGYEKGIAMADQIKEFFS